MLFNLEILSLSSSKGIVEELTANPKSLGTSLLLPQLKGAPGFVTIRSAIDCK